MTSRPSIQSALQRYQAEIQAELRRAVLQVSETAVRSGAPELESYYGQMQYQLGWVNANLSPIPAKSGKLLRPTLLLLAYEAAGAWGLTTETVENSDYLRRAMPAAAAIELTHNFTLMHDDIEDGDTERRHRPTAWALWGIPQTINTGDGMFALARLALWRALDEGVEPALVVQLAKVLDSTCLVISEGQFLDMNSETRLEISVSMYLDTITRKTAALMGCAAEMGALLGTREQETIDRLRSFGYAMGVAFQVRDDLLGVWASTAESGKTPAGDVYRRKKSLPVLHALEHARPQDQEFLRQVYQQETPVTGEQVEAVLEVFAHTETRTYCRTFLAEQCRLAHEALASVPRSSSPVATRALDDMEALVNFVEAAAS
jgi:geranylgeranyl diphosphate synthase type I